MAHTCLRQLFALFCANFLLRRKHFVLTAVEVGLPILGAICLAGMRALVPMTTADAEVAPQGGKDTIVYTPMTPQEYFGFTSIELLCPACVLGFTPNTSETRSIMAALKAEWNRSYPITEPEFDFKVRAFDSEPDMAAYLTRTDFLDNTDPRIKAGIVFTELSLNRAQTRQRVAYTLRPVTITIHTASIFVPDDGLLLADAALYMNGGVAGLQVALDKVLLRLLTDAGTNVNEGNDFDYGFELNLCALPALSPRTPPPRGRDTPCFGEGTLPRVLVYLFFFTVPAVAWLSMDVGATEPLAVAEQSQVSRTPPPAASLRWLAWMLSSMLVHAVVVTVVVLLIFAPPRPFVVAGTGAGPGTWWVVCFLYTVSLTALGLLASAFSARRCRSGNGSGLKLLTATVGVVLWLVSYYPLYLPLLTMLTGSISAFRRVSMAQKVLAFLSPSMGLRFATEVLCDVGAGGGGQNNRVGMDAGWSPSLVWICFLFVIDTCLYGAVALGVEYARGLVEKKKKKKGPQGSTPEDDETRAGMELQLQATEGSRPENRERQPDGANAKATLTRAILLFGKFSVSPALRTLQLLLPTFMVLGAVLLANLHLADYSSSYSLPPPPLPIDVSPYEDPRILFSASAVSNASSPSSLALAVSTNSSLDSRQGVGAGVDVEKFSEAYKAFVGKVGRAVHVDDVVKAFLGLLAGDRDAGKQYIVGASFEGAGGPSTTATAFYSTRVGHSVPLAINLVTNAVLKSAGARARIETTIHPLFNELSSVLEAAQPSPAFNESAHTVGLFFSGWMTIALAVLGGTFVIERDLKFPRSLIRDFVVLLGVIVLVLICMQFGSRTPFNSSGASAAGTTALILLVWGFAELAFAYALRAFFPFGAACLAAVVVIVYLLAGLLLPSLLHTNAADGATLGALGTLFPAFGTAMSLSRLANVAALNGRCALIPREDKALFCVTGIEVDPLLLQCCDNCMVINSSPGPGVTPCFEPAPFLTWSHSPDVAGPEETTGWGIGRFLLVTLGSGLIYSTLLSLAQSGLWERAREELGRRQRQ